MVNFNDFVIIICCCSWYFLTVYIASIDVTKYNRVVFNIKSLQPQYLQIYVCHIQFPIDALFRAKSLLIAQIEHINNGISCILCKERARLRTPEYTCTNVNILQMRFYGLNMLK